MTTLRQLRDRQKMEIRDSAEARRESLSKLALRIERIRRVLATGSMAHRHRTSLERMLAECIESLEIIERAEAASNDH